MFEHLNKCGADGTACQPDGTAIGPAFSGVVRYKDNDPNAFRDGYAGTAKMDIIQKFTIQLMRGFNDLTYDPTRQIPVSIHYGNGKVYDSQGIYHEPGGFATVYVNGYKNIPRWPRIPGEY